MGITPHQAGATAGRYECSSSSIFSVNELPIQNDKTPEAAKIMNQFVPDN